MKRLFFFMVSVTLISGCREKFYAGLPSPATGYLIVEGNINIGTGAVTTISLSRTTPLDSWKVTPEENATVFIEDEQNKRYELQNAGEGRYNSPPLQLPADLNYRLHVITSGKEYYSAFTETKIAPEIDSVYWAAKEDGIEIQLDTDDPQNNSRYYFWNFIETWHYHPKYYTAIKYDPDLETLVPRGPSDPQIYDCWMTQPSTTIVVGSTIKLSKDIVHAMPIAFVSASSTNKLVSKYSILVKQSVITPDAYEYYQRMKKNTEQTGSVFDAQPSQLRGNITCVTDSSETVVGFITASSITEKRIFVNRAELPPMNVKTLYESCYPDTVQNSYTRDTIVYTFASGAYIPIEILYSSIQTPIGFIYSYHFCVDCRKIGGSNIKPPFWP